MQHCVLALRGIDAANPLRLGLSEAVVGRCNSRVEFVMLEFEPIEPLASIDGAGPSERRLEDEQQRPIRSQPMCGERVDLPHGLDAELTAAPLIGE